jgi:hypothetical protein
METPPPTPATPDAENTPNTDTNLWCMLAHLGAFVALLGVPFGNIIAPIIIWQVKKDEMPEVVVHAKESLNFQITATIIFLILSAGLMVSILLTAVVIGFFMLPAVGLVLLAATIGWFVVTIIAGMRANEGKEYRYPWTIRFVK